jgi:hypothetical protein
MGLYLLTKMIAKKLFGKSAPKMFAKVRQKIQLWDENDFLSPEPGTMHMGLYLPPKMFAKVRQSVVKVLKKCLQKCAKKLLDKRAPKIFAKVC